MPDATPQARTSAPFTKRLNQLRTSRPPTKGPDAGGRRSQPQCGWLANRKGGLHG